MTYLRLHSCRIYVNTALYGIVDLCHDGHALGSQVRITLVSFCGYGGTECVVVVNQQLQAGQYHRGQAGAFEVRLLADQHLHVVWDRHANRVYDCIEDPAGVRFIELRCQVGINESLAIGDVDCADCSENLIGL